MFKIFAVLCLVNVGALEQTLCFKTQVPLDFNNDTECQIALDNLVTYLDEDMKKRQTTLILSCKEDLEKINT